MRAGGRRELHSRGTAGSEVQDISAFVLPGTLEHFSRFIQVFIQPLGVDANNDFR